MSDAYSALPLKPKGFFLVRHAHYVVFEPRYGLRCIYSVIEDVPPLNYQLLLRLCRLKHEWNNFPLTLRVLKLPERVRNHCQVLLRFGRLEH